MTFNLTLRFFQGFYYQAQFNTAGTERFWYTIILNFLTLHTLPTAEILSGKNVRAWFSMVST